MRAKSRIVIAEDHRILREGLKSLLAVSGEFEIVGEAEDGLDAIRCVTRHDPDLVLLDLSMPRMDGLSAIKEIRAQCPGTKILLLTVHDTDDYILRAFQLGANGYCLKDVAYPELLMAIRSVLSGKAYISPAISDKVLAGYLDGKKSLKSVSSWETLTPREREILKLIGEGYKNRNISEYLCISTKTVEKHRANIMKKLDLHNTSALTAYAIEKDLVAKKT